MISAVVLMTVLQASQMEEFVGQRNGLPLNEVGKAFQAEYVRVISGPARKQTKDRGGQDVFIDAYVAEREVSGKKTRFNLLALANGAVRAGIQLRRLVPQSTYLAMTADPKDGVLTLDGLGSTTVKERQGSALLAAFDFKNHTLGKVAGEKALLTHLFQAAIQQNASEVQRTAHFLKASERSLYLATEPGASQEEPDAATGLIKAIHDPAREAAWRVQMASLLVDWRVRGSEQPYLQALLDLAPSASQDSDVPLSPLEFVPRAGVGSIKGYVQPTYDRRAIANAAASTTNDGLRAFLLREVGELTPERQQQLIPLFRLNDEVTLKILCEIFDRHYGLENTKVSIERKGNQGPKVWANRDSLLSYWRGRFGVTAEKRGG